MFALISALRRLLPLRQVRLGHAAIPRQLLESAEARAGSNPRQARELRRNALAYLRVVR